MRGKKPEGDAEWKDMTAHDAVRELMADYPDGANYVIYDAADAKIENVERFSVTRKDVKIKKPADAIDVPKNENSSSPGLNVRNDSAGFIEEVKKDLEEIKTYLSEEDEKTRNSQESYSRVRVFHGSPYRFAAEYGHSLNIVDAERWSRTAEGGERFSKNKKPHLHLSSHSVSTTRPLCANEEFSSKIAVSDENRNEIIKNLEKIKLTTQAPTLLDSLKSAFGFPDAIGSKYVKQEIDGNVFTLRLQP